MVSTASSLRFTHLAVNNWKNFRHVDVPIQKRAFLVGPNASGKSNLLDAFRFLHDIVAVGGGLQAAVERERGGISRIRCLAAREKSDIQIKVGIGDDARPNLWSYELCLTHDRKKRAVVKMERVYKNGLQILSRPEMLERGDPELLAQTHLEQVSANRSFRDVAEFLSSISYMHIVPQLVRDPERSAGKKNDPFGGDLLESIARKSTRRRNQRLKKIQTALAVAVPQLKEIRLQRDDGKGVPHLEGRYEHWRPQGAWQDEQSFSDGTLRLFGLLWSLMETGGPLLLEEPELSLHPEIIRHIPAMFARMQRRTGRQILVSTHSMDLLHNRGIGLDEVLVLKPVNEGTEVKTAVSLPDVRLLLDQGVELAETILPHTRPQNAQQLSLFGDM